MKIRITIEYDPNCDPSIPGDEVLRREQRRWERGEIGIIDIPMAEGDSVKWEVVRGR